MTALDLMRSDAPYAVSYLDMPNDLQPRAQRLCWRFNQLDPTDTEARAQILEELFGTWHPRANVKPTFRCDYGLEGILYIAAFYVCRKNRIYQVLLFLLAYMVATGNQPPLCTLLACVLILLYNGKRGKLRLKYFFYAFYPIHIIILYLIRSSLTNFS